MANRDVIELALNAPIDWEKFENLVAEILQQDDLPRLRKLGGRGDLGLDAADEAFYSDESRVEAVVQVTSQRAQVAKFEKTVERLRENEIPFSQLIVVYRQPIASPTRTEIQERARGYGIAVDIRNHQYLVSRLAQPGCSLFARYFGDVGEQVDALLERSDPLAALPDRLRHAMLATVAAYVLQPRARIARQTLFEKTVLAALVSAGVGTAEELQDSVRQLLPEEDVPANRVAAALQALRRSGDCEPAEGQRVKPSDSALVSVGAAMAAASRAYEWLRDHVLENCSRGARR